MSSDKQSFRIRGAHAADLTALAALHVATFRETHGRFRAPSYEVREQQWRAAFAHETDWFCYVAETDDDGLVGFAKGTLHDGGVPGFRGELNKIYVRRAWHRRGVGRALVQHVAQRFLALGVDSMLLFGDAHSPSNAFYESLNAERLFNPEGDFHGAYGWRDLGLLAPAPRE